MSFRQDCVTEAGFPLSTGSLPGAGMLDVVGQEVIHIVPDSIAKVMIDFPHTVESSDQALPEFVSG